MKTQFVIVLLVFASNFMLNAQEDIYQSEKLSKIWETKNLNVPESVLPVPDKGILYVSNLGSNNPEAKENSGFISILDTDGNIENLKWCKNLNSPKGMALFDEYLYVTEVDHISKIAIHTGEKVKSYPVEGAIFLNDIAVNDEGVLFITDSRTGTIHKLEDEKVIVLLKSDLFPSPNGIFSVKDKIFVGTGKSIISIKPETLEVNEYLLNTGGVDGLVMIEPDVFLFSDWPGKIYFMKKDSEKELLLDTTSSETLKTADFGYIVKLKRLYVPTFFNNSVVCYELKY